MEVIGRYSSAPRKKQVENPAVCLRVRILNSLVSVSVQPCARFAIPCARQPMCARHQNSISYSHALKASLFSLESIVERRYNRRPLASDYGASEIDSGG